MVYLEKIPKYGWETIPVTSRDSEHSQFGKIGLKTEIHEKGDSIPKIIVENRSNYFFN